MKKPVPPLQADLLGEIGKYKVRRVTDSRSEWLDIREYVTGDFEGYTRRGIKLKLPDDVNRLREILDGLK